MKLDSGQKNVLQIVNRDADDHGWVKTNNLIFNMINNVMPKELIELRVKGDDNFVRLTKEGNGVVKVMEKWL